ncbi:Lactoylglutathione lyase [Wallemia ichthyophaga EXF-994]|uniref:Lactoylglutathione lyase n=1 Tax=Wallemia ichthyophaga (strain EXF-994 / CBS 113033) TaxID=1299270 RepID=R9AEZ1_WALI9|nr:Lactoylglutathione lyase [Wallemia ichthyophaga EXF-994]EOR00764.1 Lactoylglutathione lyase [Wallemia ichthyophaga EXF-994]
MSTNSNPTSGFQFNHTMYRVKNYKASLDFYTRILGMSLLDSFEGGDFTLFFLAFDGAGSESERKASKFSREGVLELTYNHGTESQDVTYANGNTEPYRGFGHIAITVPDIVAACDYFEEQKVAWKKRLTDGKMRNIAFILDPDGYWIEIVENKMRI